MLKRLLFSLKPTARLLALLIITSALPAYAQYDDPDVEMQEGQFNFDYRDDLNGYIISPNRYSGWNWDGNEPNLFIPSTRLLDGKPDVGLSGFGSLKYLDMIEFESPCHVKYICNECFEYCTSLGSNEGLNLPESIETIGDNAFYGCTRLRSVNLSSNLKSIGRSAFELCKSLESITLPNSLKEIRDFAFRNCANYDNWGHFIGGGLQSVTFEDGVDFWNNGVYCFYNFVFWGCANLSSVKLPNNTPGDFIIPPGTFGYCGNLKSITFPKNTCKIEQLAFYRTGLESLDLTNIELAEEKPFYLSGYYTFAACENLKTVTAKGKVHFDGLYIFQDCTALETVTFNGSVGDYTKMSPDIFKRCSNLRSVEFYHVKGNGQDNDMDSVFTDCTSLESVTSVCPPEISKIGYSCFDGCTSLKTLSLPEKEFAVNETAFRNCAALESFDFSNVTSIGKGSFEGCTGLTSLDFTDLTSIGPNAFKGCTALASINFNTLSETSFASTIGSLAFTGCTALKSLNFNSSSYDPPTVESEDAFDASHYADTKVNMPEDRYRDFAANEIWNKFAGLKRPEVFAYTSVTGGYSIAKGQYALDEDFTGVLAIPAKYQDGDVVTIAENAFKGLTGLTGVTLHEGLTTIGANAFAGCSNIATVINKRTEPLTEDVCPNTVFDSEVYSYGTLTVPFGSLDAYKNTAPWSNFSSIKQGFGVRTLADPEASRNAGEFNYSFDLTLTNPNETGSIYYYIVYEGDEENVVHQTYPFTAPINIPDKTCTVWAYITDDMCCSDPVSFKYTYVHVPTNIDETDNIPQGTQNVDFSTINEEASLTNVVINNIYYCITDETSGYDPTAGLVLNAMSSIEEVAQFNSDVESGVDTKRYFNGIAVQVQGTGSITFTNYENKGNARLTLMLGNGPAVYVDDLEDDKYEFSTPKAKYLYIFATQSEPMPAPSRKSVLQGENSAAIRSMSIDISDLYVGTVNGLDLVLSANAEESYRINTPLYCHYHDGSYLYASTIGNSGSSKNTFNEDMKSNTGSDNESTFNQEDWVAIEGLSSDLVGMVIESGKAATVISNSTYPVIKFLESIGSNSSTMGINSFRVENFNIHAESAAVSNIWLVAPQPAEYCTVLGFKKAENVHPEDGYFVLLSQEGTIIAEDESVIEPLTLTVYYDPAAIELEYDLWYDVTGIVSREGEVLKLTALDATYRLPSHIEDVNAGSTRISAADGNIRVTADAPTTIDVYSATGQLVASFEAASATIAVAPGFYIVKVGNQATKLSVK